MVEGRPALLRQSYMDSCRGGWIVLNEKTAIKAAAYISSCNTNALWRQMGNQPDVQEVKHIKNAKNKVSTVNASDTNKGTINKSLMSIVANVT